MIFSFQELLSHKVIEINTTNAFSGGDLRQNQLDWQLITTSTPLTQKL